MYINPISKCRKVIYYLATVISNLQYFISSSDTRFTVKLTLSLVLINPLSTPMTQAKSIDQISNWKKSDSDAQNVK